MIRIALLAACIALSAPAGVASAQDALPRRAVFGAAAQPTPDGAVQIASVRPGSPAAAAGLMTGDVLQRIDGVQVVQPQDMLTAVRANRPGATLRVEVLRSGAPLTLNVRLAEAPRETADGLRTTYESVSVDAALHRTLITTPNSGRQRRPGVLLIGGIGCYSAEDATAYRELAHDLARRGMVVMQVEKSGMGDSQGAPCAGVDFEAELRLYNAAFAALRSDRRVNPAQAFVFGHSIGSISAPDVGQRHSAAGVIIAQGLGRTWTEYELINTRRQLELMGAGPAQVDDALIWKARCLGRVLLAQEPVEQVFAQTPECQGVTVLPASQAYMAQLTAINIAALWSNLASPALIIYGDSDFVTDLADHQRLAALVNAAHPGAATLTVMEDLDHFLARTDSQASSFASLAAGQAGAYDHRFSETIADWICARAACLP